MEQSNPSSFGTPRYEQIAVDLAKKISAGSYVVGDKLHGRSGLAGIYRVSPETIRKATAILEEAGVLQVVHGNGAVVLSAESAAAYLVRSRQDEKVRQAIAHFHRLLEAHRRLGQEMEDVLAELKKYIKTD